MPTTLRPMRRNLQPEPRPTRKRWTRQDCEFLVRSELLRGRYELIEGDILLKSETIVREAGRERGHKRPHAVSMVLLIQWLIAVFGGDRVQCQLPIDVAPDENATNEPEPDAAVFAQPVTAYTDHHPGPGDLLLVVEVSDTTLQFDLQNKGPLYARAGIPEYWVLDVSHRRILVHRQPHPKGYQEVLRYEAGETLVPLARPDVTLPVASLFLPK